MVDYIRKFEIEFSKDVWYAGELLKGHIVVESVENIKVRGIRVFLRGKGHTEWKITRSGERRTVKDDQIYLDQKQTVWGREKRDEDSDKRPVILPRGQHKWPFSFQLPETALPPSFESRIGTIRYYIRAVIDIPYASNPMHLRYFTIVGPFTDCMEHRFLTPQCLEISSHTCWCFPCWKPMTLTATLERSAYCCGEHIKLSCTVLNGSEKAYFLRVKVMQHGEFFITRSILGLSKPFEHTAMEYSTESIKPHSTQDFELNRFLRLPCMPPTLEVDYCKLLRVSYKLKIALLEQGHFASTSTDLQIDIPITIATVPFRIPNLAPPKSEYACSIDCVEGGMYISPQFRLNQVYDGTEVSENGADLGLLYQPVYLIVHREQMLIGQSLNVALIEKHNRKSMSLPDKIDQQISTV